MKWQCKFIFLRSVENTIRIMLLSNHIFRLTFILSFVLSGLNIQSQVIKTSIIVKSATSHLDEIVELDTNLLLQKANEKSIISADLNLYLYEFSNEITAEELNTIKEDNKINNAWYDHAVTYRSNPNDELFIDQYAIKLSQIDNVWDFTTGGTTVNGKEIVVAVLDDGFDVSHEDLDGVFWTNEEEIPNNNKDDDQNGFVDDYQGLNIITGKDNHTKNIHGTSVCGIIGAKGNNEIGIAGVNWNIKILPISSVKTVANIIRSYDYVLQLRRKYNTSNGLKGAFIAVTSFSAGIENAFPSEDQSYMEWCDIYDLLGNEGILSFGAAPNLYVDVDEVGDMPTLCTSEYFISVSGLFRGGKIDDDAGYGKTSVDLAAPSVDLITTSTNNKYAVFNGTSAATPMAAATAALLFSAPCEQFGDLIETDSKASAKFIRKVLLEGVTNSAEMKNLYSSGGYLNGRRALTRMIELCDDNLQIPAEIGALRITETLQFDGIIRVYFVSSNEETHFLRWTDPLGRELMYKEFIPQSLGERNSFIDLPLLRIGAAYLSLGNGKKTVTKGYFFREQH